MKKITLLSLLAVSLLAFSCGDDDGDAAPANNFAAGWTQAEVDAAIDECVNDGGSQAECECVNNKIAEQIPKSESESLDALGTIISIGIECVGLE